MRDCIPADWETTDLDSVAVVTSGQSPPGSTYNTSGKGLPFFQGKAEFGDISPTPVKWCSEPLRIAHPGDVLMSVRAPVGPTNLADTTCCIGRGLAAITPLGDMPSKFYLYYLRFSVEALVRQATGTTFQAISGKQLRAHEVLVPPLAEQHRIVEAIESYLTRLDDAVASLERVQRNLERYRASVLKAAVEGRLAPTEAELARQESREYEPACKLLQRILAARKIRWLEDAAEKARAKTEAKALKVGKPWTPEDNTKALEKARAKARLKYKEPEAPDTTNLPTLPEGWCWASVEQLASDSPRSIQSGPFGSSLLHSEFQEVGRLVIGIDNVQDGVFAMGSNHRITERKFEELARFEARPEDVLVTVMGTIGRCCVVPQDIEPAIITKHVYRVSPNHELVCSEFLLMCLRATSSVREQMFGQVRGQTRPGLNGAIIKALAIPLPPPDEQTGIVNEVESLLSRQEPLDDAIERGRSRSMRLRQSILKWAFEGKLVEQDPSDESASALLERIRTGRH